jgi:glycogen debranching enzyme
MGGLLQPASAQRDALLVDVERDATGLVLDRPAQKGTFLNVVGRRSGFFGYENETFEVWTYPLKVLHDVRLEFEIEGYPLPYDGRDLMTHVEARPEATVITYTHAAFTVRQIVFAPVNEPGLVMLLDVDSARPVTVNGVFRPDLRLMWPAGLSTENIGFDADSDRYQLTITGKPYAGVVAAPGAEDVSLMPYQEEPRDVPVRFTVETTPEQTEDRLLPIVVTGSMESLDAANATADRLLDRAPQLYQQNVDHYAELLENTMQLDTPDDRLDEAFAWAMVGMEKGMVENPMLGTGLIAGYRTAGASERPGFAWFFGRDALWTAFALTAAGDVDATRTALDFLAPFQRDDGKIPHEISQSAALLDWFEDFPYPWASADATPLYIIAHADLWQTTGDRAFLAQHWSQIKDAYAFSKATDTDGNQLIENTDVGHGWVEGGELYPPHEELYMQGLWVEAARSLATLAEAMGEDDLAEEARQEAEQTRQATEETYWQPERGHYAFATKRPSGSDAMYRQDTVLPGVPMWWGVLDSTRVPTQIDHLGSGAMATDWGHRIVSNRSEVYDALSYHHGSVWPLFTGWASMGAYTYTRPHVGYQALMSTALLTEQDALGYVTELLSGDYNTAFGRTSHHQIWSEAMVVTPAVRGMLGIAHRDGGRTLRIAPQLPADWDSVSVRNLHAGGGRYDLQITRTDQAYRIALTPQDEEGTLDRLVVAPAVPRDAAVRGATVNGQSADVSTHEAGDRMRARVAAEVSGRTEVAIQRTRGSDAILPVAVPEAGATNQQLRILRSTATADTLTVVAEGRAGRTYRLPVRSPHTLALPTDVTVAEQQADVTVLSVPFLGDTDRYVRRTLRIGLE